MNVSKFLVYCTISLAAGVAASTWAQTTNYFVDFEGTNETKSAYASGTVNLSGKNWDMTDALIGTSVDDWKNGLRSARMRGYGTSSMTMLEDVTTGLGTLSFSYRRYGTAAQVDWKVEYSTDGGGTWTQIGSAFTAPSNDEVQVFSEAVNVSGNVRLRIKRATETGTVNRQLNIDDIAMTEGGAGPFAVSLNRTNGFVVETGSSDTITAAAANGTEPYTYDWASSLGAPHYTADSNLFTILATAPEGTYTSTVTVTDSAGTPLTTNKSVSFSVVPPPTKYAIAINPTTNGTVTTTPATNAIAGATVTINATPESGYVVNTIAVVDETLNPVQVTGNTFTMPAMSVTITVSFMVKPEGVPGLIISQYYEGASYNKWIEIYNASDAAVDMAAAGYYVGSWNNASREAWKTNGAATTTIALSNTIAAGATYIIAHASATSPAYATPNQTVAWAFTGDDSVILYTNTPFAYANIVDALAVTSNIAQDKSFVRTNTVDSGVNTDFDPAEWIEFSLAAVDAAGDAVNERIGYHSLAGASFNITFNKADGFEVEQGASDTIMATAVNGTAPFTFAWTSSLSATHYGADSNLFNILATAPLGTYTTTVTATDSSGPAQTTNKTITFSVVAPPMKYPITITPPTNGAVTTTPATEAAAGVTVTINATPTFGYAVDTITVVDSGANPVTVTGNTFTMPALGVTVTVTFKVYIAPDVLIDFETNTTMSVNSYVSGTSTVNNIAFSHTNVLRGGLSGDRKNGLYSGRFRQQDGTNAVLSTTVAFGQPITKLSFWYANYGTDNSVTFKVQFSPDGSTWQDVGGVFDPESTNLVEGVLDSIPAGMTYFQFITTGGTGGNRMNVDDIGVFFGLATFAVTVDRTNGFTVTQGTTGTVTATASNGTEPYSYGWNSTLGSAYYTAAGNVFTILGTAPAGDYSATVTATDSADPALSTNRTVNFSVVAAEEPPPITTFTVQAGSTAAATIGTRTGKVYVMQFTTAINANPIVWTDADTKPGTGNPEVLQDTALADTLRIYRIIERDP